jgi:hypothetical protein
VGVGGTCSTRRLAQWSPPQRQGDIPARVPSSAPAANSRGTGHEAVRLLVLVKKRALQRGARTPKGGRGCGSSTSANLSHSHNTKKQIASDLKICAHFCPVEQGWASQARIASAVRVCVWARDVRLVRRCDGGRWLKHTHIEVVGFCFLALHTLACKHFLHSHTHTPAPNVTLTCTD